ncbi:MAG: transcription antitermination factor NusB [Clostridia bacterium]|nr:transcription antitermination factor NusB [Clostridia bacterium]
MLNCFYDSYTILNKVYSENAYVKQAINSTFIEEKNRALTVKICYGVLDKDIELSYYIKQLTSKTPKLAIRTLLKIAMYSITFLGKKPYAVCDNTVSLAKKLGKSGTSGFINAFLRKYIGNKPELPKGNDVESVSIRYSYPQFLVKELIKDYGKDEAEKIMCSKNAKNCLCFYGTDGKEYLKNLGKQFENTPYENVYLLDNFSRELGYDKGIYTFQALGSVAICEGIKPCEKILDCCAAPGGKSVRLSYKCKNVYSWDKYEHRVKLIDEYAYRMHRENVITETRDAKIFDKEFENFFDAVLVDAPCSGSGVINDNPDIKLNREESSLNQLVIEQKSILKTVSRYVKPGGYLYYSTCSILFRENIEIIRSFMSDKNDFELQKSSSVLPNFDVDGTIQFLPHISGGNGFYFAVLKRRETL